MIALAALEGRLNTALTAPFILNAVSVGAARMGLMFTVRGVARQLGGLLSDYVGAWLDSVPLLG